MIHAMLLVLLVALIGLTPTASPAAGKDFVIGLSGDATSLNPVIATDGQSYIAEWPLFDSLVELDQGLNVKPSWPSRGRSRATGSPTRSSSSAT